jgi:hypothetical protein
MAVIDICKTPGVTLTSASLGFGFHGEMTLDINTALFDSVINVNDIVLYRVNPSKIIYKGIVRKVPRTLKNERASIQCVAAENILEAQTWEPTYEAYNKVLISRRQLLNAKISDVIAAEFTNNDTGPQDWFTDIEVPSTIADLIVAPTDTYQSSFLSIIQGIISTYPYIQWFIEYDESATTLLPLGKLVFVDTRHGRTSRVVTVGEDLADVSVTQDASNCAGLLHCFGGGDFVETDETLIPAWDVSEEQIPATIFVTAPLNKPVGNEQMVTNLAWGYDLTSTPQIAAWIGGGLQQWVTLIPGADYTFDYNTGTIIWNIADIFVNDGGSGGEVGFMKVNDGTTPIPPWRHNAVNISGFLGTQLRISYVYAGPDCYRLYKVSKPIGNKRLRLTRVPDPKNPGHLALVPVDVSPTIEAFKPNVLTASPTDTHFKTLPQYAVAKVWVPDSDVITLAQRNSKVAQPIGYCIPVETPAFDPAREFVRFEARQLATLGYGFVGPFPYGSPLPPQPWMTWQIKLRYAAWNNLLEERAGVVGDPFIGRFVFNEQVKYTTVKQACTGTAVLTITNGIISHVQLTDPGFGYATAPNVEVLGDGAGAVLKAIVSSGVITAIQIINGGSGYTTAAAVIDSFDGCIRNDTARLAKLADDVQVYYGNPQWAGNADIVTTLATVGTVPNQYKVADLPFRLGDLITLDGAVDAAVGDNFSGIVNNIDLAQLEKAICAIGFGTQPPNRNPFEPVPPVFVDVERNGNLVLDIAGTQRRSI